MDYCIYYIADSVSKKYYTKDVSKDFLLSIENDTPVGRAVLSGDTTEIDLVAAIYSFNEWLINYFGKRLGRYKLFISLLKS